MRRTHLIFAALALLAIACVPVEKDSTFICADGIKVKDLSLCKPIEPAPGPEVTEPEPVPVTNPQAVLSDEVKELIAKSEKVKIVKFYYFSTDNVYTDNLYYASRDKMKVILQFKSVFDPSNPYDTVYLDLVNQQAVGYCEWSGIQMCRDRNMKREADFDEFVVLTPFDWLAGITEAELTGRSKLIDGRNCLEVKFKSGNDEGLLYVDQYYGMPLQVAYGGKNYEYRKAVMNEDKLEILVHTQMENK